MPLAESKTGGLSILEARNRAPGMLLQNKAHYATYFGNHFEPLTI